MLGTRLFIPVFPRSRMERIKALDKTAKREILGRESVGLFVQINRNGSQTRLHPFWKGMDLPRRGFAGYAVRGVFFRALYPEKPTGTRLDLEGLEQQGITDVFLNEPEVYVE